MVEALAAACVVLFFFLAWFDSRTAVTVRNFKSIPPTSRKRLLAAATASGGVQDSV